MSLRLASKTCCRKCRRLFDYTHIREQESHDIALDKLSVKEYEDPFKRR